MIEPRELRIGNLLYIQTGATSLCPIEITGLDIYDQFKGFIPSLQPIPLTEEWLVKFGFEKKRGWDDSPFYKKNDVDIYIVSDKSFTNELDVPIKHVHQLQNLYYALTGEELPI